MKNEKYKYRYKNIKKRLKLLSNIKFGKLKVIINKIKRKIYIKKLKHFWKL